MFLRSCVKTTHRNKQQQNNTHSPSVQERGLGGEETTNRKTPTSKDAVLSNSVLLLPWIASASSALDEDPSGMLKLQENCIHYPRDGAREGAVLECAHSL